MSWKVLGLLLTAIFVLGAIIGRDVFPVIKPVEIEKTVVKRDTVFVKGKTIIKEVPIVKKYKVVVRDTIILPDTTAKISQDTVQTWYTKTRFINSDSTITYGYLRAWFFGPPLEKFRFNYTPVEYRFTETRVVLVKPPFYRKWTFGFFTGAIMTAGIAYMVK